MHTKHFLPRVKESKQFKDSMAWLHRHNIMPDRQEEAKSEAIFNRTEGTGDWSEWDSYIAKAMNLDKAPKWWVNKPVAAIGSPISHGSDEYNRGTTVIGFPFTGQIIIPTKKKSCSHYDKEANATYVYVQTTNWIGPIETIEVGHGVNLDINPDTGELVGVEIFH